MKKNINDVLPQLRAKLRSLKVELLDLYRVVRKHNFVLYSSDNIKFQNYIDRKNGEIGLIEFFIEKYSIIGWVTLNSNGTIKELEDLAMERGFLQ